MEWGGGAADSDRAVSEVKRDKSEKKPVDIGSEVQWGMYKTDHSQ